MSKKNVSACPGCSKRKKASVVLMSIGGVVAGKSELVCNECASAMKRQMLARFWHQSDLLIEIVSE